MSKEMQIEVITYEKERLDYFTDLMKKAQKKYKRLFKKFKDAPILSAYHEVMCNAGREAQFHGDVVEMLEKGYRKQSEPFSQAHENGGEWISVEERLPEAECPVLIFTRKNRYYVGYYYKALIDQTFTGFYADAVKRDVTHWMPLPEPPKKGGAE